MKLLAAFGLGAAVLLVYLVASGSRPAEPTDPEARVRHQRGAAEGRRFRRTASGGGWSADPAHGPGWTDPASGRAVAPVERPDPQVRAMRRSYGAADAGIEPEFWPVTRRARLASASGDLPVSEGAACEVRVLPVKTHRFNCLIKVSCDGIVLYPEPELEAGYVTCDLSSRMPTRAVDDGVSGEDGDPTVEYDLRAGRVVVSDARRDGRSYAAELVLDRDPLLRM